MTRSPRTSLCLSLSLLAAACDFGDVIVGATVPAPSVDPGASSSGEPTSTSGGDPEFGTAGTTATGVLVYGEVCEMMMDGEPWVPHSKLVQEVSACTTGICVFPSDTTLAPCDGPEDCAGVPWQTGSCSEFGVCNLDLEWVQGRSLCTQTCELDTDCPDADACPGGFACQPVHKLEPYCCEKLCVCKDDVPAEASTLAQECMQPNNGC